MKSTPLLLLAAALAAALIGSGCAQPQKPRQFFANVTPEPVGAPMRVAPERPLPRRPPLLPTINQIPPSDPSLTQQPPPPPPDTTSITAAPTITSPVPQEADAYFEGQPPQTSALGALFQSIFQPPQNQPTVTGSATYQVVP